MEQQEENQLIGPASVSDSGPGPMVAASVGRVMTTLLNAKPKKLQDAISRLQSPPKVAPPAVSLEQSLWFLHKYVGEAAEKGEHLDQVLVPIIQHSIAIKGSLVRRESGERRDRVPKSMTVRELKHGNQALILLNWLFQDEFLFHDFIRNLADIISRRDDHYVALGWCILGRNVIEYENIGNNIATNAIRLKYDEILKIFCPCIPQLLSLICNGSKMHEGFELPTRLAVAAADFILSLTVALTKKDLASNNTSKKQTASSVDGKNRSINLLHATTNARDENTLRKASELPSSLELKLLLWNNLSELIKLVKKLAAWHRKSRSLHAKGLERVLKWLQEVKQLYGCFQSETDFQTLKTGCLLLSSCWKHYGILLRLEDHKFMQQYNELLNQYLSGIQFYADNQLEEPNMSKDSKSDTINFFLNCLLLLLGQLDDWKFGNAITEFGSQISQILLSQLRCADEDVIDGAICIFKAVILKTNHTLSKRSLVDVRQMDALLPMLLNLLDEQDAAAKAIVNLVAEYCSICSDNECLHEVVKRIGSKNIAQRRNAVDLIANVIHLSSESVNTFSQAAWQDVAKHLLECLGDEDLVIQNQAANLILIIDPPLVLPALVGLIYSTNEGVQILASSTLIALLVNHKQKPETLCMMLDSLSKLSQNLDSGAPPGSREGSTLDVDRLMNLLPEWAKHVEDWRVMVGPLIEKMLSEPSNAVVVRFLSHISEYLAEAVDLVFHQLVLYMREKKDNDECFSKWKGKTDSNSENTNHEHLLFSRLCPLLVIRLLPLRVFDDLNSPFVYGEFPRSSDVHDRHASIKDAECIAALMINRALSNSEFEDVRKLAAELCGRIHPQVLIPILSSVLESAANAKDIFKAKACLFSLCTSLMVRGNDTYRHPDILGIRKTIQKILSWKSVDRDEISKAQHGCIDCLALMLCTELKAPESSKGAALSRVSVLEYVINQLTGNEDFSFESDGSDGMTEATARLSFRLCIANVLISACQKISDKEKKPFVRKILPRVIHSIGVVGEPEIRAACIQVLFAVAYHLKSSIFPYSNDLLDVALKSLQEGSQQEKLAGAKLLACLMASEDEVVERVSAGLLEARTLLQSLSSTDPFPDVRQICQQLLACLTTH